LLVYNTHNINKVSYFSFPYYAKWYWMIGERWLFILLILVELLTITA
jgi:hypothetical protein